MDDEIRYWYAARRFRWGPRRPLTWEGWAVDLGLLASMLAMSPYVSERAHPFTSLGLLFGVLALYAAITRWKGEPDD